MRTSAWELSAPSPPWADFVAVRPFRREFTRQLPPGETCLAPTAPAGVHLNPLARTATDLRQMRGTAVAWFA
jgi:hypothetical protein